jgi:hypothetical protein
MPKRTQLDLGSFEEDISSPKRAKKLTWRRCDTEENFSDWTIIVKQHASEGEGVATPSPATYHVHKCVLGAGPRSSEYFHKVFQSTELEESKKSTSVLELEPSAAEAFPDMLDFMYEPLEAIALNPYCAVAVRHLASYFRVPALFEGTKKFIEDDMGPDNINHYLKEGQLYQDDEIIRATMKVAADNWLSVFAPINNASEDILSERLYLELLPQENQVEVMQLALQRAGSAYRSFKRVPSQPPYGNVIWKGKKLFERNGGMAMKYNQHVRSGGRCKKQVASLDLYFDDNGEACYNSVRESSESDSSESDSSSSG